MTVPTTNRVLDRPLHRRAKVFLGVLFLVSLALRIAHIEALSHQPWFQADQPAWDSFLYNRAAWNLACGEPWRTPELSYVTAPPYVAFLAMVFGVFGHNLWIPRLIQAVLGAALPLMLYDLGRRSFGGVAGWVAAFLAATYGLCIFYDGELLKTSISLFFLVLGIRWLQGIPRGEGRPGLAGVVLVLALGMPGGVALLLPVVAVWVAWQAQHRRWRSAVAFLMGAAVPLVPFHTRHLWAPPERIPFAYPAGIHLYIGNHPKANGAYVPVQGITPNGIGHVVDAAARAETVTGRKIGPREASAWWTAQTLKMAASSPTRISQLMLRKFRLLLNAYEIPNGEDFYYTRRFSWVLRLPLPGFGVMAPLAFLGVVVSIGRRPVSEVWVYLTIWAVVGISLLCAFVTARYRLHTMPIGCLFAGAAIQWAIERFRNREWRALVVGVIPCAMGAAFAWAPTPLDPESYMASAERKTLRYYPPGGAVAGSPVEPANSSGMSETGADAAAGTRNTGWSSEKPAPQAQP